MNHYFRLLLAAFVLIATSSAFAFDHSSLNLGLGYFLEENLGKETTTRTGEPSTLGTATYPLYLRFESSVSDDYFIAPTLTYTVLNRKSAGDSAEVTTINFILPFGGTFGSTSLDWYAGPGVIWRQIKGSGGTTTLNNGTGTATFALPGQSISTRNYTLNLGSSYRFGEHRIAFDILSESALSEKRSFDFMLSYSYRIWGGGLF